MPNVTVTLKSGKVIHFEDRGRPGGSWSVIKEDEMRFRKKPVEIEAMQLRWDTWSEMCDFAGVGKLSEGKPEGGQSHDGSVLQLSIPTLEGVMIANENDWIIRGIKGELYPCKPDIFEQTYEAI